MAEGKREYQAIFAIGAKLQASFRGVMNAAQARLRGLQQTATSAGRGLFKLVGIFGTLFSGIAAFAGAKTLSGIFEDANAAAEAADQRTRQLVASLMQINSIRKQGRAEAIKQAALLHTYNQGLAKQQFYSQRILDAGTSALSVYKIPPKYLAQATAAMADLLAKSKGVAATEQDMAELAQKFGKAVIGGRAMAFAQLLGMTKPELKTLSAYTKAGQTAKAYAFLMERMTKFHGEALGLLLSQEGQIAKLKADWGDALMRMGEAFVPARAQLATALRPLVPMAERVFTRIGLWGYTTMAKLAKWIQTQPFQTAWAGVSKSFTDMMSKIGVAFGMMLGGKKGSVGDAVIASLGKIAQLFRWIGDNANWLVPLLTKAAVGFGALAVAAQLALPLMLITAGSPVITGLLLLITTLGLAASNWDKLKEHANSYLDAMAHKSQKPPQPLITVPRGLMRPGLLRPSERIPSIHAEAAPILSALTKGIPKGLTTIGKPEFPGAETAATFARLTIEAEKLTNETTKTSGALLRNGQYLDALGATAIELGSVFSNVASAIRNAAQWATAAPVPPGGIGPPPKFALGGIASRHMLASVGERGPEAIIPLSGGRRAKGLLDYASRALGMTPMGGATTVNFAPNVTIHGNATETEQRAMDSRLRDLCSAFIKQFQAAQAQERRLSFESGYG